MSRSYPTIYEKVTLVVGTILHCVRCRCSPWKVPMTWTQDECVQHHQVLLELGGLRLGNLNDSFSPYTFLRIREGDSAKY